MTFRWWKPARPRWNCWWPRAPAFDVVVLDVMLPGKDGFAVISAMRHAGQFVPTLMLTARGQAEDVLRGFAAGADDYLTKPFDLAILMARIKGLLRRREWVRAAAQTPRWFRRRGSGVQQDTFSFGDKSVDFGQLELRVRGQVFPLDPDGGESASLPDPASGPDGVAQGNAGGSLGTARRHRYARDRQFHRAAAALHRG